MDGEGGLGKVKFKFGEFPCPNCKKPNKMSATSCVHCGIDFSKAVADDMQISNLKLQFGCLLAFLPLFGLGYCMMQPSQEEAQEESERLLVERDQGLHCLDGWNGENLGVVARSKSLLRDPDSFEHVSTRIGRRKETGSHTLRMTYRARNGFGGTTIGAVRAELNSHDCSISDLVVE